MTKWVGCATLVNVMTGLLKDPIITVELAEFISGLKQYNPKNSAVSNFQSSVRKLQNVL